MKRLWGNPKWERGHRVHGLWMGMFRAGWVGLPQGRSVTSYYWCLDIPGEKLVEGRKETLMAAKRAVEREYESVFGLADRAASLTSAGVLTEGK
jgi:hypothetical protein